MKKKDMDEENFVQGCGYFDDQILWKVVYRFVNSSQD